jgi:hypothetical protein
MIDLFFPFYCIVKVLRNTFSKCCGGPLYGPAVYSNIRQIIETGFTSRAFLFEKAKLLNGRF